MTTAVKAVVQAAEQRAYAHTLETNTSSAGLIAAGSGVYRHGTSAPRNRPRSQGAGAPRSVTDELMRHTRTGWVRA